MTELGRNLELLSAVPPLGKEQVGPAPSGSEQPAARPLCPVNAEQGSGASSPLSALCSTRNSWAFGLGTELNLQNLNGSKDSFSN